MMKKCCNKYLVPKIYYRASIIDSIGLIIFLGLILLIAGFVALGISSWLVSIAENGTLGKRHWYGGREGGGAIILFSVVGLLGFLPVNLWQYVTDLFVEEKSAVFYKIVPTENAEYFLPVSLFIGFALVVYGTVRKS